MSLAKKLNLKDGMKVRVEGQPKDVSLDDVPTTKAKTADGLVVFVKDKADLDKREDALVEVAAADGIAWVAYPKAGQLGTDLNRDILWSLLQGKGIRPVRQVSIDDVWSALRFRPE